MTLNWYRKLHHLAQDELNALQPRLQKIFAEQLKLEKITVQPALTQRFGDFYLPLAAWLASRQPLPQHYERITRASLQEMPKRAHLVAHLNQQQQVEAVTIRASASE
ncbi:MAG: hypothetical protein GXP10_02730 [Gammaproteobacteria bacterium]|nr:hypothetical protein [Gammaproteobacteria bacterium]